jgi:hypothetical protein
MPILNISINITEDQFRQALLGMSEFGVTLEMPGNHLYRIATQLAKGKPLNIFSTGCIRDIRPSASISDGWDTIFLAKWVNDHPGSRLDVAEIDGESISQCLALLNVHELGHVPKMWRGDSIEIIRQWESPVDLFVLDSADGLDHGLEEFRAAEKHNPQIIVMDDWETKAMKAAEYANEKGIFFHRVDRYTIFKIR